MNQNTWAAVDDLVAGQLAGHDDALEDALRASADAGLPPHQISANQGKFLQVLARLTDPHAILEIGTLGGYSTIWLARALQAGGRMITIEANPRHADVARSSITKAGLNNVVEVQLGNALDILPRLRKEGRGPFDFTFIDADKEHNPDYFEWAMRLARPGAVIVVDNVVRGGRVVDENANESDVEGARRLFELMADEPRVSATVVQTVGKKGYDGFAIAVVKEDES